MQGARPLESAARIALRCLDLTSLSDTDGEAEVAALCRRAQSPFGAVAAVCVWPRLAAFARRQLPPYVAVAAVANFPAGGSDVAAALRDVRQIAEAGVHDDALVARAAGLALDCGADLLKTSTGKTPVGATPAAALSMLQAIVARAMARDRAGLKVSGGIRRVADALPYIELCHSHLGEAALQPQRFGETWQPPRFRIGASSLLDDIEAVLGGMAAPPAAGTY
jgi:deoxyribose-phosphate aldolase